MKELVASQQQNLDILARTIEMKDQHGVKMRVTEIIDNATKMQWYSGQLDALRNIPYDMIAEDMAPRKRVSSAQMAAVVPPVEKSDPDPEDK